MYVSRPTRLVPVMKATSPFLRARSAAFTNDAPKIEKLFLDAVSATSDEIVLTDLSDAIASGNLANVLDAIPWSDYGVPYMTNGLAPILRAGLEDAAGASAKMLNAALGKDGGFVFDVVAQAANDWVRTESGALVQGITSGQRVALHDIMTASWQQGISPNDVARQLRDSELFGLTSRDAKAVLNLGARLKGEEATRDVIARQMSRKADQLLASRADSIARTETADAYMAGQRETWDQAQAKGYIDPNEAEQEWAVIDPCDICSEYDGMVIGISEDFPEGDPTLHPRCECIVVLHPFGAD